MTINSFSAFDFEQTHENYITLPFFYDGKPASASFGTDAVPECVMSLAAAGSLRYNSGLENPPRQKFLKEVLPEGTIPVPVYLVHSKRVFVAEPDAGFPCGVSLVTPEGNAQNFGTSGTGQGECGQARVLNKGSGNSEKMCVPLEDHRVPVGSEGDGVITSCRSFAPCVTAADCMPVFLWDSGTGVFGICHSGWKGTGIAAEVVSLMSARFGAKPENICVILGPHIHDCCYTVDAERAAYFSREFSPDCCVPVDGGGSGASCPSLEGGSGVADATGGILAATKPSALGGVPVASVVSGTGKYRLSLARANIVSLTNAGIKPENILHCTDCTSCFSLPTLGVAPKNALVASEARACDLQSRDKNAAINVAIAKAGNTVTDGAGNSADAATAHVAKYFPYGSFRRQTAHLPEGTPLEERFKIFSAMAAVIGYLSQRK